MCHYFVFYITVCFASVLGWSQGTISVSLVTSITWHSGHTQQHLLDNLILTEAQTHMTCGGEGSPLERQVVGEQKLVVAHSPWL